MHMGISQNWSTPTYTANTLILIVGTMGSAKEGTFMSETPPPIESPHENHMWWMSVFSARMEAA